MCHELVLLEKKYTDLKSSARKTYFIILVSIHYTTLSFVLNVPIGFNRMRIIMNHCLLFFIQFHNLFTILQVLAIDRADLFYKNK